MLYILIVICAYIVYRSIAEIRSNAKHLTDAEILEYKYHRNALSTAKKQRVTNHIGTCEECKERFMGLLMN